ncbi:MAG: hypothetical protein HY917_04650 [Candidatus Diapherotrites archaeon]|nr:hypothetical protein [Candidatus Diapherotrites archaeon]
MITKTEIRKNRLDLQYQKQLQKYNALLIFITTGILGFIGGILTNPTYALIILLFSAIVVLGGLIYYFFGMKPKMEIILTELCEMEKQLPA